MEDFEVMQTNEPIAMPPLPEEPAEQPQEEQVQEPVEEAPQQVLTREESAAASEREANIRKLRKLAEQAAHERDELARRLQEYESRSMQKFESQDEDFGFKEDDLIEGKHLKTALKKIKQLEEQQRQYANQANTSTTEIKLRSQFPDFDKVVTLDNVQKLSEAFPELATTINAAPDLYNKAVSAYTLIKRFGIYNDIPQEAAKQKALANTAKPRPLSSVAPQQGNSPLSRANAFQEGFSEAMAEQYRKEMNEARKLY